MTDIHIRTDGRAGRITLNRPKALNALTYDMVRRIDAALVAWAEDDAVSSIVIDAAGDKAFCAGGDIAEMYRTGRAGDFDYGRRFWRDEYVMNARIAQYPKPVFAFMQGFVMGGGVGVGCHASARIVAPDARVAMPECGIGLMPDVGGTLLLARAPGRLGEYLALTGARMGGADAVLCGFADAVVSQDDWAALQQTLIAGDDITLPGSAPDAALAAKRPEIDHHFGGERLGDILTDLRASDADFAAEALAAMERNSPLAMACAVEVIHRLRGPSADIGRALEFEYRFSSRAMEHGDFLEGIRAAIIDKDRTPRWRHEVGPVPGIDVANMLRPVRQEEPAQ